MVSELPLIVRQGLQKRAGGAVKHVGLVLDAARRCNCNQNTGAKRSQ